MSKIELFATFKVNSFVCSRSTRLPFETELVNILISVRVYKLWKCCSYRRIPDKFSYMVTIIRQMQLSEYYVVDCLSLSGQPSEYFDNETTSNSVMSYSWMVHNNVIYALIITFCKFHTLKCKTVVTAF